ncbi:uncharacterized protein N7483_012546 [Penicillium malachiteum]|uniref:uncharacterized protein n=1 Tax=Penicillium malachiteum TaxID=1324776 RepID=UPI0025492D51|nr:uncharacterized protein N7483_012546 [Penicillium malachiteum]KAJ5715365.1 hypothetical protein N7483_012546 [Penicillium malachiteum]
MMGRGIGAKAPFSLVIFGQVLGAQHEIWEIKVIMADPMNDAAEELPPDPEGGPPESPSYGMEEIRQAILQNRGAVVEQILVKNPDIREIRFDFSFESENYVTTGMTPLIFAAFLGRYTIAKLLLSQGANMLTRTKSGGVNAFLATAMENFLDVGKLILEAGGPTLLGLQSTGRRNALCLVAWKDGVEYPQYLLDHGVDVKIEDQDDQTALHAAALRFDTQTPVMAAAWYGHFETFQYLVNKGADMTKLDASERTVLHLAVEGGDLGIVKFILENTDPSKQSTLLETENTDGDTAFLSAADFVFGSGSISQGMGQDESTPLMLAAENGMVDVTRYFIEKEADTTKTDAFGNTLLHLAAHATNTDILEVLLENTSKEEKQTRLERRSNNGDTPLEVAIFNRNVDAITFFLDQGAQVDAHEKRSDLLDHINEAEETGLSFASSGNVKVVEYFCTKGANVNFQQLEGETALFRAMRTGSRSIVDYLMTQPIDFRLTNNLGRNVLHHACDYGFLDVVAKVTNVDIAIIFLFLESDAYFLSNPAQDKGLISSPEEKELISVWLERWIKVMARELGKTLTLDRRGVTWLHVAALVGKAKMEGNVLLDNMAAWEDHLLEEVSPRNKATPFSIAVKEGNSDMVELFLDHIDSSNLLGLLVRVSKQEESLIWQAAINRKNSTEQLLWKSLFRIIKNEAGLFDFAAPHGKDQELLMGLAAWRYTTGIEYPFNVLMDHMEETLPQKIEHSKPSPTSLQLIVRHKFPVALWWLLSSGTYFGDSHIKEGRSEMEQWDSTSKPGEKKSRKLIKSLLDYSPPERPLSNFETELLDFRFRDTISDMQEGTVVDLTISDQNNITIQFAQSSMKDIIYAKGPDQIMRENKNYSLKDIDSELFGMPYLFWGREPGLSKDQEDGLEFEVLPDEDTSKAPKLTLVPDDAAQPLDREGEKKSFETIDDEGFPLPPRESAAIISTGRGSHDERVIDKMVKSVAEAQILMVNQLWLWTLHDDLIITSTTQQPTDFDPTFLQRALRVLRDQSGNLTFTARQVVDFILHTARDLFDAQEIETRLSPQEKKSPLEISRESLQSIRDEEADLFTRFMNSLGPNKNKTRSFEEPSQSGLIKKQSQEPELPQIPIATDGNEARGNADLGRSILGFHGSLRNRFRKWKKNISQSAGKNRYEDIHREIDLLYQVKDILDELNMLKNLAQDQEHIHSIWKGIELGKNKDAGTEKLNAERMDIEMKNRDIEIEWKELEVERREIEMMRKAISAKASDPEDGELAAINQRVQEFDEKEIEIYKKEISVKKREREILKTEIGVSDLPRKSEWNPPVTPRERVNEIQRMIADAQSVQNDITSLLDLKQKEATIIEAQATRRQSDSVMVFTVVTVIFLPASFLASLFALNVVEYPHRGDSVAFQGRWIFPII